MSMQPRRVYAEPHGGGDLRTSSSEISERQTEKQIVVTVQMFLGLVMMCMIVLFFVVVCVMGLDFRK